ncbi:DNA methyltransferase [Leuconostoc mesenteroides subsp. mesenteroides]|nr:DNA methyltransferase [Leuconostoc mesenteroides subsp. mesenteroides]
MHGYGVYTKGCGNVMANTNLSNAKRNKKDEFYTQWSDIEKEMNAYIDYDPDVFRNKTILLPADDPFESNFFKFFATKFNEYGLKKLIATSYAPSPIVNTQLTLLPELVPEKEIEKTRDKQITEAYKIELNEVVDENGTGTVNIDDVITRLLKEKEVIDSGGNSSILSYLKGDDNPDGKNTFTAGDFRSREVTLLRDEADIIVTNPPFSLFRKFIAWVNPTEKQFSIIGNMNAVTYREIFPLIKDNVIWYGPSISSGDREFMVPDSYPLNASGYRIDNNGNRFIKVKGVRWFTNIDHGKRHQPLSLMSMADNVKFNKRKKFQSVLINGTYPIYDNYPAIEVPETMDIPNDYDGVMGVPITFLDKFSPDQFTIIGAGDGILYRDFTPNGKGLSKRFVDDYRTSGQTGQLTYNHPTLGYYNKDGKPVRPYFRILIERKK